VEPAAAVDLGSTYPEPMVDHAGARVRALAAYDALKEV
jgi:deoxyribodipyrimidine photo-lyase